METVQVSRVARESCRRNATRGVLPPPLKDAEDCGDQVCVPGGVSVEPGVGDHQPVAVLDGALHLSAVRRLLDSRRHHRPHLIPGDPRGRRATPKPHEHRLPQTLVSTTVLTRQHRKPAQKDPSNHISAGQRGSRRVEPRGVEPEIIISLTCDFTKKPGQHPPFPPSPIRLNPPGSGCRADMSARTSQPLQSRIIGRNMDPTPQRIQGIYIFYLVHPKANHREGSSTPPGLSPQWSVSLRTAPPPPAPRPTRTPPPRRPPHHLQPLRRPCDPSPRTGRLSHRAPAPLGTGDLGRPRIPSHLGSPSHLICMDRYMLTVSCRICGSTNRRPPKARPGAGHDHRHRTPHARGPHPHPW
jgi:hypothetical protein